MFLVLREKCPNTEFFLVRIFLYSARILENKEQKKLGIWELSTQCEQLVVGLIKRSYIYQICFSIYGLFQKHLQFATQQRTLIGKKNKRKKKKIRDSHLKSKVANKCLNVPERVEVLEWNKRWSPPFPCCPVSCQCLW